MQRRCFDLRKSLVQFRRVAVPMREVVNTLVRRDLHILDEEMGPYFQDAYDHVLRVTEWTESLRDLVTSVVGTNLTIRGNRLNIITKQVTSWAAIIAVTRRADRRHRVLRSERGLPRVQHTSRVHHLIGVDPSAAPSRCTTSSGARTAVLAGRYAQVDLQLA